MQIHTSICTNRKSAISKYKYTYIQVYIQRYTIVYTHICKYAYNYIQLYTKYIQIYTNIYRERERDIYVYMYINIYVYIYNYSGRSTAHVHPFYQTKRSFKGVLLYIKGGWQYIGPFGSPGRVSGYSSLVPPHSEIYNGYPKIPCLFHLNFDVQCSFKLILDVPFVFYFQMSFVFRM